MYALKIIRLHDNLFSVDYMHNRMLNNYKKNYMFSLKASQHPIVLNIILVY